MKSAVIVVRKGMDHQQGWGDAFAAGLRRRGWSATVRDTPARCDLLVVWGVRRVPEFRKLVGSTIGEICVLERGYLGDRFKWTSVSFGGGLNGRGVFRGPFSDPSRWQDNFSRLLRPWRERRDGYALILQQVPGDNSILGVDMSAFYDRARAAFEPFMPVKTRPHPNVKPRHGPQKIVAARESLDQDLAGARLAVTYNSNSAVDAVLAGVPTIAMDRGTMAWDVTGHQLVEPQPIDRMVWAHALAWKQWRRGEMESGYCQEMIGL